MSVDLPSFERPPTRYLVALSRAVPFVTVLLSDLEGPSQRQRPVLRERPLPDWRSPKRPRPCTSRSAKLPAAQLATRRPCTSCAAPSSREWSASSRSRRKRPGPASQLAVGEAALAGDERRATLQLGAGASKFTLKLPRPGRLGLYTQHLPSEFQLRLTSAGEALVPTAEQEFAAAHTHDADVTSVGIHLDEPVDLERLNAWLSVLLRDNGADIFRLKGILNVAGSDRRFVFQGVHMLLDAREDRPWGAEERASDVIFIGRKLDRATLTQAFQRCAVR